MINQMVKELNIILMVLLIEVNLLMESRTMKMQNIDGQTEKYIKVLSKMDIWKDKEDYTWKKEKDHMLDNFQEI